MMSFASILLAVLGMVAALAVIRTSTGRRRYALAGAVVVFGAAAGYAVRDAAEQHDELVSRRRAYCAAAADHIVAAAAGIDQGRTVDEVKTILNQQERFWHGFSASYCAGSDATVSCEHASVIAAEATDTGQLKEALAELANALRNGTPCRPARRATGGQP